MSRDAHDSILCVHCTQPAILTDETGLCPRCYYRLECEAICAAAEGEVDRLLSGGATAEPGSEGVYDPPSASEPAWTW